jgi:hypothetical protein
MCNLCEGDGVFRFYHPVGEGGGEDFSTLPCPHCKGAGTIEPWRQMSIGGYHVRGWAIAPSYRETSDAICAIIRQRDNP